MNYKEFLKNKLTNCSDLKAGEKAVYNNALKFSANLFLTPKGCNLSYSSFGISVIPDILNLEHHDSVTLEVYYDNTLIENILYLPHQVYLHDLVMFKWKGELQGLKVTFKITCNRKQKESVLFT